MITIFCDFCQFSAKKLIFDAWVHCTRKNVATLVEFLHGNRHIVDF
jgi:hypothetical protein